MGSHVASTIFNDQVLLTSSEHPIDAHGKQQCARSSSLKNKGTKIYIDFCRRRELLTIIYKIDDVIANADFEIELLKTFFPQDCCSVRRNS